MKVVLDEQMNKPYTSGADVLLVHDTESFYHMGSSRKHSGIAHWANNWVPVGIFKSGVAHDAIHIDDLDQVNINQYKAIVFVNTFVIHPDQRKYIQNTVAKNNRHLIWMYAPGYSDGKNLNTQFINQVTGMKMVKLTPTDKVVIDLDSTIVKDYSFSLNTNYLTSPVFVIQDEKATTLGSVKDTSFPGIASKKLKESTSWFMSLPIDNAGFWKYVFDKANVHSYTDSEAIIYSGSGTITVHTKKGGAIDIMLKNGKTITYTFPQNATRLLDENSGAVILK
jgi:hypothetical protein